MRDGGGELFQPALPICNLDAEQVLMVAVERLPFQIFVCSVPNGYRGARQDILNPPLKARLFLLRRMQRSFVGFQYGDNTLTVGFSVSIG
jgi:hypothetical protein